MKIRCNDDIINYLKSKNIIPLSNYINSTTKMNFKCNICNHIWNVLPRYLCKSGNCPNCTGIIKITNEIIDKDLQSRNIKRISDYKHIKEKLEFKCLKNTCNYIWKSLLNNVRLHKHGCPNCANNAKLTNEIIDSKLAGRNILRLNNVINSSSKLKFKCLKDNCHHEWETYINNVLHKKSGCAKCAGTLNINFDFFCKKSNFIHNNKYDYSKVKIKNNQSKVIIICPIHKEFEQIISNHMSGKGCYKCNRVFRNQSIVDETLTFLKINFENEFCIKNLNDTEINKYKLDFYLPNKKIAIEYNGEQHYKIVQFGGMSYEDAKENFKKQIQRDLYVKDFCKNNNIKLIEIDSRKYKYEKLKNYILNDLSKILI